MITLAEQIAEAPRELALRRQCYPGWIKSGKLDASDAHYQFAAMEAIARTLPRLDVEQRQLSLFSQSASFLVPVCGKSVSFSNLSPQKGYFHAASPNPV